MLDNNLSYKYNTVIRANKKNAECYKLTQGYDRVSVIKAKAWLTAFDSRGGVTVKRISKSYFERADKKIKSQEFIILSLSMPSQIERELNTAIPELKLIEIRDGYDIKIRFSGSRITKKVLAKEFTSWVESINALKLNHDLCLLQTK